VTARPSSGGRLRGRLLGRPPGHLRVLTQNISLPPWVFTLTLTLLLIGLPITAATAYFQGIGRPSDGDADAEAAGSGAAVSSTGTPTDPSGLFTWGNVLKGGVATLAMWGIAVTGWMVLGRTPVEVKRFPLGLC